MGEQNSSKTKPRGSKAILIGSIGLAFFTLVGIANVAQSLVSFSVIFSPMTQSSNSPSESFASASANLSMASFMWFVSLIILISGLVLKNKKPQSDIDEKPE